MSMNFLRLIGIVGLTALAQGARAELKWEQTSVDLQPALGDKQAVAHFKYENVGRPRSILHRSMPPAVAPLRKRKESRLLPVKKAKSPRHLISAAVPAPKSRPLRSRPTIPIPRVPL